MGTAIPRLSQEVHSYSGVQGYSEKGVTWVWSYRDSPGRFIVTVVYGDTLTKEKPGYMAILEQSWEAAVTLVYGDTLTKGRPGYGHLSTVPGRSTVTVAYRDTLTKGQPGHGYHGTFPGRYTVTLVYLGQGWVQALTSVLEAQAL